MQSREVKAHVWCARGTQLLVLRSSLFRHRRERPDHPWRAWWLSCARGCSGFARHLQDCRCTKECASNETGQRGGSNPPLAVGLVPSALSTWAYLASLLALQRRWPAPRRSRSEIEFSRLALPLGLGGVTTGLNEPVLGELSTDCLLAPAGHFFFAIRL